MSKSRENILEQRSAGIRVSTIEERTGRYDRDGDWNSVFKRKMHRFVDDFAGVEREAKGGGAYGRLSMLPYAQLGMGLWSRCVSLRGGYLSLKAFVVKRREDR